MKITDQGFTSRLGGQSNTSAVTGTNGQGANSKAKQSSSDNLQLSSLASLLQKASAGDSDRSARVSQIARAVSSNTYQVNSAQISGGIVSEALNG